MPNTASETKKLYRQRKKGGYCPRCGTKIKSRPKTTYCEDCINYFSEYRKENADIINQRRRDRKDERKDEGKCTRCGIDLPKGYRKTLCVSCLDRQYKYNYGKKRPKKNNNNNFLDEGGSKKTTKTR